VKKHSKINKGLKRFTKWLNHPGNKLQLVVSLVAVALLLGSIYIFKNPVTDVRPLVDHVWPNIWRTLLILAAVIMIVIATRHYQQPAAVADDGGNEWLHRLSVALPVIALIFMLIQLFWPEFATLLVRKETWPFFRNSIFIKCAFEVVGVIFMVIIAKRYFKHGMKLAGVIAVIVALVLFVMAGEELSWGQRIFKWDTPESMISANEQKETNLHNLATQLFQNTLYFGCWLLLVAMPFLRKLLQKILENIRPLRFLVDWLPPVQFLLMFAVGFAFCDPLISKSGSPETGLYYNSNLFIVLGTLTFLVATLVGQVIAHCQRKDILHTSIVLLLFVVIAVFELFFNRVWSYNAGAVTEYLELFAIFGVMLWTVQINRVTKRSLC